MRQLQDRFAELQEVLGRVSESEHHNHAVSTSEEAATISVALRESAESELTAIRQQLSEFAQQKLQPRKSVDAETQARIAKSQEEQRNYWVEKQRVRREKQQEEAQQKLAEQHGDVAEGFRLERVLDISWEKLRSNVVDYYYLRSKCRGKTAF